MSTLYKALAHAKYFESSLGVSLQRLLAVEILQLLALTSSCHSRPYRTQLSNRVSPSLFSLHELLTLSRLDCLSCRLHNPSARTTSKIPFLYCCVRARFSGNVFAEPLLRNGGLFIRLLHSSGCCLVVLVMHC
jgi:hypothetical protein